jgi:hypothetical protein
MNSLIRNGPGEKVKTFSSARLEETQRVSSNDPTDSEPDKYGVIEYTYNIIRDGYEIKISYCMQRYLNELQINPDHTNRKKFTNKLWKPPCDYQYCFTPEIYAFLITWQRVEMFITDTEDIVSPEIVDFIRYLARNEVKLSDDPIPKNSVLGLALIALGIDNEYTLIDDSVKE